LEREILVYPDTAKRSNCTCANFRRAARALLRRGRLPKELDKCEENIAGPWPFRAGELDSLLNRFRLLADKRRGHGLRHRQPFVLGCAAIATLMGAGGYQAFEDTCSKFTQRLRAPAAAARELRYPGEQVWVAGKPKTAAMRRQASGQIGTRVRIKFLDTIGSV